MKKSILGLLGLAATFLAANTTTSQHPQIETQMQQDEAIAPKPQEKLKEMFSHAPYEPTKFLPVFSTERYFQSLISKRNPKRKKRVQARW